jgi:hypothetical protein
LLTVTLALADLVVSATETVVTVTVAGDGTDGGALYRPLVLIVPTVEFPPVTPFTFHITAVFDVFDTVAVNCFVFEIRTVALLGEMLTLTGGGGFTTLTAALPNADGTATLAAWTVTFTGEVGAV